MPRFRVSTLIRAPIDRIFWLAQDYGASRREWDCFIRDTRFLHSADRPAIGVHSWTKAHNGLEMVTEFVAFEPPHVAAVKMVKGPFFIKTFAGTWRFKQVRNGVEAAFTYYITTLCGLNRLVTWTLQRDMRRRLRGLKRTAEARYGDG